MKHLQTSKCHRMEVWIFLVSLWTCGLGFSCMDENGNNIDWFSVYKSPKIEKSQDWKFKNGLAHFYLDVTAPVWKLSPSGMNETSQAVYTTLSQVYREKGVDSMYILYNDEPPGSKGSGGFGHTKGVVAFDKSSKSGFWLIHSTPHFPPEKTEGYSWPSSGTEFGQTFLCVTFDYNQLGNVGTQLLYNHPDIYDKSLSDSIAKDFPILNDVLQGKSPPGVSSVIKLPSLAGQTFVSFAKSGKFHQDLYDGLVAPTLQQNLLVETWLRTKGTPLDSNCTAKYKVMKVTAVSLPNDDSFRETEDHSKWAVSASQSSGSWTCIGDINRMKSQFKRGGGTMCLQLDSVWKAFYSSVSAYDKC